MSKEIIEKKRWIIMVPIVMVILLLISLEVYVDIKSQKIDDDDVKNAKQIQEKE